MAGVGFGTAEMVFEGALEDCLMSNPWQDPESVLGQGLDVSRLYLSVPILSRVLLPPLTIKWDKGT